MNSFMKPLKSAMIVFLSIVLFLAIAAFGYLQHPKFGKSPDGKRLELIQQSPNFKNGIFQNSNFTPYVTEGHSMSRIVYDFTFKKFERTNPSDIIPSVKTDLKSLPLTENILVWFGHSSYFIQLNGIRFLIDPVFSGNASPVPYSNRSFKGSDVYSADDLPNIDYLLISHDHYDHLDYETIMGLKSKIDKVVCGLGVGSHFEHWKFDTSRIIEKDWNEKVAIDHNMTLHTAPARHFSGRGLTRNNTLWLSYVVETSDFKLYLGGDSGYDTHFAKIGEQFGGFDLAILDNGQYNKAWQEIHMAPEEVLKATEDLKAKRLFPVHSAKFKLAFHPWDEPLTHLSELNNNKFQLPLVTPKIGEIVYLKDTSQVFEPWWTGVN